MSSKKSSLTSDVIENESNDVIHPTIGGAKLKEENVNEITSYTKQIFNQKHVTTSRYKQYRFASLQETFEL